MKLAQLTNQYVALKQSMGSRFRTEAAILKAFCRAMGDVQVAEVKPDRVRAYLDGTGAVTRFWHRKHTALSGFYRFAVGRGYAACSPLPRILPKPPAPFKPYIFTQAELRRLLQAADAALHPRAQLQGATLRTLLLLLYGAGLRIGEALALTVEEVDLHEGLLTIRPGKFYKSRLVPIGPRLAGVLRTYAGRQRRSKKRQRPDSPFFLTRSGNAVTRSMAERAFCRLRGLAGVLRDDGARYQPRLHDLRHAFAVHRLVQGYREGADLQRLLPQLSAYLGHLNVSATQRYLTLTPELLKEAGARFERYACPEVDHA